MAIEFEGYYLYLSDSYAKNAVGGDRGRKAENHSHSIVAGGFPEMS